MSEFEYLKNRILNFLAVLDEDDDFEISDECYRSYAITIGEYNNYFRVYHVSNRQYYPTFNYFKARRRSSYPLTSYRYSIGQYQQEVLNLSFA